jgi:hypothetical protein
MKVVLLLIAGCFLNFTSFGQDKDTSKPDTTKKVVIVDAACGQCQFGLPGTECDLAVRFNGKAYYVDGTHIDQHGDAHATDGFCNTVRKAEVQGELVNNHYKVTYFKLLKPEAKKE